MPTSHRAGFTLVEVLVAVVLIDFALLAMVGASATLLQRDTELRARRLAARSASNRLAILAATTCTAAHGTADAGPVIHETWSAVPGPDSVRDIRDSVSYVVRRATHLVVLGMQTPC